MAWQRYEIPASDKRAKEHVLLSLSIGAHAHTLTKRLISRFSGAEGPIFAFGLDGIDINSLHCFDCEPLYYGKPWSGGMLDVGERPNDGLLEYLFDILGVKDAGLIVMEDWLRSRFDDCMTVESRTARGFNSRMSFFNDEVFHVIAAGDNDLEIAEDAIRSAETRYLNGICVRDVSLPDNEFWTSNFLDELVDKTESIFVGAFDISGYLVWTPTRF
jgi:hypothetical protein